MITISSTGGTGTKLTRVTIILTGVASLIATLVSLLCVSLTWKVFFQMLMAKQQINMATVQKL